MQVFPLAFTGDQGNLSCRRASSLLGEVINDLNSRHALDPASPTSKSPIQHLHTQVYHRSRVTLRRTQKVQDMSLGLFVPRIALRQYAFKSAQTTLRRFRDNKYLGRDGQASERRFHGKLRDTPQGVRFETMIKIDMNSLQDHLKQSE